MSTDEKTDAEVYREDAVALAQPHYVESGGAFALIPEGYKLEDIEQYLPVPARARGFIFAETPDAFVSYYNRFCDEAASLAFASSGRFHVKGILDWHRPDDDTVSGTPGFGQHCVIYDAPRSAEWQTWTGLNGEMMNQTAFAQFIEENVKDIREPDGADVLEVSRELEVTKKVNFTSATRLSDGQRTFGYSEDVEGSARRGQMKIPTEFKLGIPVFVDGALYEVTARLRYRIDSGQLRLWFDLLRPDEVARDAFATIVDEISEGVRTDVLMAVPG